MTLSHKDLNAIQAFFSPIEERLLSLENQVKSHFNMTDGHFDALFKSSETFKHEYLVISDQLSRVETRLTVLEGKER